MKWPPIVELRQYTLLPGKREVLIEIFEQNFIESQEAQGISLLATFRDLDDDAKFTWMRGFTSQDQRAQSLADFYYGPVWKAHRDAANATMLDSDNVLMLTPLRGGDADLVMGHADALGGARGVVEVTLLPLERAFDPVSDLLPHVDAALAAHDQSVLGVFATSTDENSFPALPIREGEHFLLWLTGYPDRAGYDAAAPAAAEARDVAGAGPGVNGPAQALRLEPTRRTAVKFAAGGYPAGRP